MKNLKKRFMEDSQFAMNAMIIAAPIAAMLITAAAKLMTASTYTYRASKMK